MNSIFKENIQMINSPEREIFWAIDVLNRNGIEYACKDPQTGQLIGELAKYVSSPKVEYKSLIHELIKDLSVGHVVHTPEGMDLKSGTVSGSITKIVEENFPDRKYRTLRMPTNQICIIRMK